ncbi:MAG: MFS transporter [Parachlamydiales bacterium]
MQLERATRAYYLIGRLLDGPLWSLYCGLLVWILVKQVGASPLQITLLMAARPTMALLSSYWSALAPRVHLKANIIGIEAVGKLPALLFPFVGHPWFYIGAYALYMMSVRGAVPAWLQLVRQNVPHKQRSLLFSSGFVLTYGLEIALPILLALFLDIQVSCWRWLFFGAGALSVLSIYFNSRIPMGRGGAVKRPLGSALLGPWREALSLFRRSPDFFRFEWIYFVGGFGFLMARRAIPETALQFPWIGYGELMIATSLCRGVGYLATSRLWAHWLNRVNFYHYCALVFLVAALVPLFMLGALVWPFALFIAYLFYGVMRGGDDLSWHLAADLFSGEEESTPYSSASNIMLGVRGLAASLLGGLLVAHGAVSLTFVIGSGLILFSAYAVLRAAKTKRLVVREG